MEPTLPRKLEPADWENLNRWERSEVGRDLRRLGLSYGEIMALIPVAKGTLAGWCRDIELSSGQIAAIKVRCGPRSGPRDTQWRRRLEVEQIRAEAQTQAASLINDPFWVAGTVLYWAEGDKTRRALSLSNTDPSALRLFIAWCRRFHIADAQFVLSLHLHQGNQEVEAKDYWSSLLGVAEYYKTFIKPSGTGHRKNKLPHGVCRAYMRRSADAWLRTDAWIGALADLLDC